jgi:hypothetical protein
MTGNRNPGQTRKTDKPGITYIAMPTMMNKEINELRKIN